MKEVQFVSLFFLFYVNIFIDRYANTQEDEEYRQFLLILNRFINILVYMIVILIRK